MPPKNPFLIQDSFFPMVHYNSAQTDVVENSYGGGGRVVKPEEVNFQPGGMGNPGLAHRRYQDGREAICVSGPGRVAKYRFDEGRLELINEIKIPGHESDYMSGKELAELVAKLDAVGTNDEEFLAITQAVAKKTGISSESWPNGMYGMMDRDGYFYAGFGTVLYKFGDKTPGDAGSELVVVAKRDIKNDLPEELAAEVSRFLGVNMTYDGHVVVALSGVIGILDRDLTKSWLAPIPGEALDNGVIADENNGIYVVTDKFMRKLVWKGDELSLDEADGAWKEPYDWVKKKGSLSRGSGTTPTLMGFGEGNDRLVLTVDQGDPVKVVAFWRDEIPDDAVAVQGAPSKRTAGSAAISFPVKTTIEWSPHVYGYGTMVMGSEFPRVIPADKGLDLLSTVMTMGTTVPGPRGAEKFQWNTETNRLESAWVYNDKGLAWQLSPISTVDNAVYLNTAKDGLYSLTGLDWDTGKVIGTITLGKSVKFNTGGTFVTPLSDGGLYINGFFGPVRIAAPAR
ncbi:hypothetical protein LPB19_08725 [Marinobacter salinisoli]|uniref:WD40 repeat domain-containing protein n=1 Tax=Marinobacter salinisoli TaxID=2769486 RepID=A0ABX7MPL6_9GAMM|nr:hypothetical protein [Marinobacter salinisoli]QSP93320.1 hypothetical protein LPB19_08725 [Marinobacter salinisoli]